VTPAAHPDPVPTPDPAQAVPGATPGTAETATATGDYYSVPLFLMQDYLRRLGAVEGPANSFTAAGWTAELRPAPWRHVGSLRIGGTTATFSGSQQTLDALLERLHLMTMRGGG